VLKCYKIEVHISSSGDNDNFKVHEGGVATVRSKSCQVNVFINGSNKQQR